MVNDYFECEDMDVVKTRTDTIFFDLDAWTGEIAFTIREP